MSNTEKDLSLPRRPSLFWLFTETGRALFELSTFVPYQLFNMETTGDGHPVMVLPGFMTSDASTGPLRKFVTSLGYETYSWGMGRNLAKKSFIFDLILRLEDIFEVHKRPVSLIGQSLGGVYARQVAKARPELVRQVITLGSPFGGIQQPNHARWMYDVLVKGKTTHKVDPELVIDIPHPAPVPTTAIYSKEDGIVPWEACLEIEDEIHQNIQVRGSHIGMGINPSVLKVIADRLTYKRKNWTPFKPQNKIEDLLLYPSV